MPPTPPHANVPQAAFVPGGQGEFLRASHTEAGLTLQYKLYVPKGYQGHSLPLVVMLHGCFQDADDFASGTGMNRCAREQGFFVLYPEQSREDNPSQCWNWFDPAHQQRGLGEPAVLAGMVHKLIQDYPIDRKQVFVAGMSSGGAMAVVLGKTYPDLFKAVGVHSGLAYGAAHNMEQALDVMANGEFTPGGEATVLVHSVPTHPAPLLRRHMPIIVFQGDRDRTVHPRNAEHLIQTALQHCHCVKHEQQGISANGRAYDRVVYQNHHGHVMLEHWTVHDLGHAWSGGSPTGSYTDRHGPDASGEMLRFFFAQAHSI